METKFKKVTLFGTRLWWNEDDFLHTGGSPIAPAHHVDEDTGELDINSCFYEDSYAHAKREGIFRYGVKIGEISDLVEGW